MTRAPHGGPAVSIAAAALLLAGAAMCAGTAPGSASAGSWVKTNSCPPGYQLDGQNSQQCVSASPPGPQTAATGCTTAGYTVTGASPDVCRNADGYDTQGHR